ncbi:MAG: hypothetical protein GY820_15325 [Gammaproteobacteria bacterium]|nr:hypothetical protein [Gammaproteobacteria bacterium]
MSVISDSIKAMKEVLLLTDKVEQAGGLLSDISKELRDHDKRIIKLETRLDTYAEVASIQSGKRLENK